MGWDERVCGENAAMKTAASTTRSASDLMTDSGQESPGLGSQAKVSGGRDTDPTTPPPLSGNGSPMGGLWVARPVLEAGPASAGIQL